jgi:molecular chaperone GrpE
MAMTGTRHQTSDLEVDMVGEQETGRPDRPEAEDQGAPEDRVRDDRPAGASEDAGTAEGTEKEASVTVEVEPQSDSPERLTALLEDARAKADDHWNQLLRAQAELENQRRRHATELEKAHKYALDGFVRELLQVRDSLELGHDAASDDGADVEKLREGTELTLKLLTDVMGKFGVEQIHPDGEPFNPELHQAMTMQPRGDVPPNTVVSVVQKGYLLNGRLVRPALVIVSRAP